MASRARGSCSIVHRMQSGPECTVHPASDSYCCAVGAAAAAAISTRPSSIADTAKRSGSIIIPLAPTSAASPPQATVPKVLISDLFLTTARLLPSRSKRSA